MKWVAITSFTEYGYFKLVDFLKKQDVKAYVPLPTEICEGQGVGYIPHSFYRVWRPVLDVIANRELDVECYRTMYDISGQVDLGLKIAILVLKAKAYEKIDESEWLSTVPIRSKPVKSNWNGVLVIDDYIEYLLVRRAINPDKVLIVDLLIPTPIDLLVAIKSNLFSWKCSVSEVIDWCVEYLGEYIERSIDLTEAYKKLLGNKRYLNFLEECIGDLELLR